MRCFFIYKATKIDLPGQLLVLHVSFSDDSPLHVPPWASSIVLFLVFVLIPPPQVFEQLPTVQVLHVQFTI